MFTICFSVASKHTETKQFFTLYNTLEDTKTYLFKEVSCHFHKTPCIINCQAFLIVKIYGVFFKWFTFYFGRFNSWILFMIISKRKYYLIFKYSFFCRLLKLNIYIHKKTCHPIHLFIYYHLIKYCHVCEKVIVKVKS